MKNIKSQEEFFNKTQPLQTLNRTITNNIYGFNHFKYKQPIMKDKDMHGYLFFTRPQLNLSNYNIKMETSFHPLLTKNPYSIERYIRTTLDPRLQKHFRKRLPLQSPLVDPYNAFIPVLTNNVDTITGWPDEVVPTKTTEKGLMGEEYSYADGYREIYGSNDLEVTFKNTAGEPIVNLFKYWKNYPTYVFKGNMSPYGDLLLSEGDYHTRMYLLVLSADKKIVRKIAATGASFPINEPNGQFFDYNSNVPYNDQTKQFTIRMKSDGAMYNEEELIWAFNEVVGYFNSHMRDLNNLGIVGDMYKLEDENKMYFNHRGYPRIDPDTKELEWWVHKSIFEEEIFDEKTT